MFSPRAPLSFSRCVFAGRKRIYYKKVRGATLAKTHYYKKVRGINQGTFSGCKQPERVEFLGENTGIGEQAFWDCTALSELILPKGLSWLPRGAISGCTSLKSLTLPDSYKGEPMFLPKDITYIVRRGSAAEKTLAAYNAGDLVTTPIKYTVTD